MLYYLPMKKNYLIAITVVVACTIGPAFPVLAATSKTTVSTEFFTPAQSEAKVREYFKDIPVMIEIARCESKFRQFTDSGTVLRGGGSGGMIGVFQFFESIHSTPAKILGFDLATLDGNLAYAKHVYTTEGTVPWNPATLEFTDTPSGEGVLRYQVEVDATGDSQRANDVGYAAVSVEGAEKVLVVEGRPNVATGLEAAFAAAGIGHDTVATDGIPAIDELAQYASVVLVDVDRFDLGDGQVAALSATVRDLGRGMLVVGGTQAYGLGGYRQSDLEELLPVISEITDPLRRQTVAEVLAIDTSGSMGACHCDENGQNGLGGGNRIDGGVTKTAIARNAAALAIAALGATDEVGVLTMDATDRWAIDLQVAPSQDVVDEGLAQLVPDGPTFVDTGLLTAAEALRKSNASLKHIIFFSDGFTEPGNLTVVAEQAADLFAEGITVSVVATGEGAAADLEPIAEAGGGRFYPGRNLDQIPELIVQEAVIASRDFVNEGEFYPILASGSSTVSGLTQSPAVLGYVATTPKPTARVDLRIGPDEDPLLTSWRVGLGRVSAWSSDAGERWLAGWDGWEATPGFWAGVLKETFPVAKDGGGVTAKIVDGELRVAIEGTSDWPADATARVRVAARSFGAAPAMWGWRSTRTSPPACRWMG